MNILQLCNKSPYPPRDGGSMAAYSLSRCFVLLGLRVTILTMCTPKHRITEEENKWLSSFVKLFKVDVDTEVKKTRLALNYFFSNKPYNAVRFVFPAFRRQLIRVLESGSFDVVQLEGLYLLPYIRVIRRYSQAVISFRAHNVEHELWGRIAQTEKHWLKRLYFMSLARRIARFEKHAMNRYDVIVPITQRDNEQFDHLGNIRPSHVCPAGLDPDAINTQEIPPFRSSLFFIGSLEWKPNQDGLIWFVDKVMPVLRKHFPDLRLHIAGRNAPSRLAALLSMLGVEFYGEIKDAHDFMQNHGILVAPCFSGGGMRVKVIEAMSIGIPVITTTIGAEGLAAIHGEQLLIADSIESFVMEISRLINNPEFYMKIGNNARTFIGLHFNSLDMAKDLVAFYNTHRP